MRDVLLTCFDALYWKRRFRIIRRPAYIRGRKYIDIGRGFTSGVGIRLDGFSRHGNICITIGDDVQVNDYVHISALESVKIGNNVLIASKVFITDHGHGTYRGNGEHDSPFTSPKERELFCAPVVIEDKVWLGEFVAVLPGVTIGAGSIIGALSVVTHDIPSNCIAVGVPAKVIKKYNANTRRWEVV